ncbi:MAG: NAD(P)/FAD-dependent oxidoreductase [Thermoleophilia bacterium]
METNGSTYGCVVVGGGAAGLSAALVLGRALVPTLVVDAGRQSNLPAHAVGGLLGFTGAPEDLYAAGRDQLDALDDVDRVTDKVTGGTRDDEGFTLTLASGRDVHATRVILATGMAYTPPGIPGLADLWGDTAFHCPFCHGHEVRGRPLAVLVGAEEPLAERALLLSRWTDDLVLLTDGREPTPSDRERLGPRGIGIETRRVTRLETAPGPDGRPVLVAVLFDDGGRLPRDGVMVATAMVPNDALATALGAAAEPVKGVTVDAMRRTGVPGLYAAGDVAPHMPQVSTAIAAGAIAAAMVVRDAMEDPPAA